MRQQEVKSRPGAGEFTVHWLWPALVWILTDIWVEGQLNASVILDYECRFTQDFGSKVYY